MKVIAIERKVPEIRKEDFTPQILRAEAMRVWELHLEGKIRELYFRQDEHSAVLMMECENAEEANDILHTLPLVNQGLIAFETITLIPYDGFERLFAEENQSTPI